MVAIEESSQAATKGIAYLGIYDEEPPRFKGFGGGLVC